MRALLAHAGPPPSPPVPLPRPPCPLPRRAQAKLDIPLTLKEIIGAEHEAEYMVRAAAHVPFHYLFESLNS